MNWPLGSKVIDPPSIRMLSSRRMVLSTAPLLTCTMFTLANLSPVIARYCPSAEIATGYLPPDLGDKSVMARLLFRSINSSRYDAAPPNIKRVGSLAPGGTARNARSRENSLTVQRSPDRNRSMSGRSQAANPSYVAPASAADASTVLSDRTRYNRASSGQNVALMYFEALLPRHVKATPLGSKRMTTARLFIRVRAGGSLSSMSLGVKAIFESVGSIAYSMAGSDVPRMSAENSGDASPGRRRTNFPALSSKATRFPAGSKRAARISESCSGWATKPGLPTRQERTAPLPEIHTAPAPTSDAIQ